MNLSVYSYNGVRLDGTGHFKAIITKSTPLQPEATPQWTNTNSGKDPYPSGKQMRGLIIELQIQVTGSPLGTDLDTLTALFDTHDRTFRKLLCSNTDDSNYQWYLMAWPVATPSNDGRVFIVRLAARSPIWLSQTTVTETVFFVAASGQTATFTPTKGNYWSLPIFQITPTAAKSGGSGGSQYGRFITTYNYTNRAASGYHIDITNGGLNTQALIQNTAKSNQINHVGGYTSAATTFAIDTSVGGGLSVGGGMCYCQRTGEQIGYAAIGSGNMTGITRGIGGTTAAALLDNDILVESKMLANGNDVRIFSGSGNGKLVEIPRWPGVSTAAFNTTGTKIWISLSYAIRAQGTLVAGINNTDTTFTITGASGRILAADGLALIDSELVAFDTYTASSYTANDLVRGAYGTTAAAHSAGAVVRFVNATYMYYGDQTASAPVYSNAQKPSIDLDASTNDQWVFTTFRTTGQFGVSAWSPVKQGVDAVTYTNDKDLLNSSPVSPVTDIGVSLVNKLSSALWQTTLPFGYASAVMANIDRRNLPANQAYFRDSASGASVAIAANTTSNTWQLVASQTFTPPSPCYNLQLYLQNTKTINYATRAAVNVGGATINLSTLTSSTSLGRPYVALGAEQAITYSLNGTLTNTAVVNGATIRNSITIVGDTAIGQTIEIDTLIKKITYLTSKRDAFSSLQPYAPRDDWLPFYPGVVNTLTYTEIGCTGVNVLVKHQDRNNSAG